MKKSPFVAHIQRLLPLALLAAGLAIFAMAQSALAIVTDAYEPDGTVQSALQYNLGDRQTRSLFPAGDADWVKFTAVSGSKYCIRTYALSGYCDTYILLYGTDGSTQLAFDDDSGGSGSSKIVWTCPANGTYYVKIRHFDATGGTGDYEFSIFTPFGVSGVVTDASGKPIASLCVCARDTTGFDLASTWTNVSGGYTLDGLEPGACYVYFSDRGWIDGSERYFLSEYYNDKAEISTADPVTVVAGQYVTGINAQLGAGGSISGIVRDSAGRPVSSNNLTIYDNSGSCVRNCYSSSTGSYSVGGLKNGNYKLRFGTSGSVDGSSKRFKTKYYNGKVTLASADAIAVVEGQTTLNVDGTLDEGGKITGTVTSPGGAPIQNVSVNVYDVDSNYIGSVHTGSIGTYEFGGLVSGQYRVKFEDHNNLYASQYYGNVQVLADATPVSVTDGQTSAGVNASLVVAGHLSGTVAFESGMVDGNVNVYDDSGRVVQSFWLWSDGYFTGSFAPGTYRIMYEGYGCGTEYYRDRLSLSTADRLTVAAGQNLTGLGVTLSYGGSISGHLYVGSQPCYSGRVTVYDTGGYVVRSDETWNSMYTLSSLHPGSYVVGFRAPGYVEHFYTGAFSVATANHVIVSGGATRSGIDFQLKDKGGSITGRVTDESGNPLMGATVSAYDKNSYIVASANTSSTGAYNLTGFVTDAYTLRFSKSGYAPEYYDNVLTASAAKAITASYSGTVSGIDAALGLGGRITGRVTNSAGQGLASTYIQLYQRNASMGYWEYIGGFYSDSAGYYTVSGLLSGDYRLCFSATGYASEYYNDSANVDSATSINVFYGQTTTNVNALLTLGGNVSGSVTDLKGQPIVDAWITFYDASSNFAGDTMTDASGSYSIRELAPGPYSIRFEDWNWSFASEYYNHKSSLATADRVTVQSGLTTFVDTALFRNSEKAITLSVSPDDGLSGPTPNETPTFTWGAVYNATGYQYRIDGGTATKTYSLSVTLPAQGDGLHSFAVRPYNHFGNYGSWATHSFTIQRSATGTPKLDAPTSPTKSGQVTFTGSAGVGAAVSLQKNGAVIGSGKAGDDGRFSITVTLTEGKHSVSAVATGANGISSAASNTIEVLVDLTAPALTLDGNGITVGNAAYTATGTVSDAGSGLGPVTLNGLSVTPVDGKFSTVITLVPGTNTLTLTASDAAGNSASATAVVAYLPASVTPTAGNGPAVNPDPSAPVTETISFGRPDEVDTTDGRCQVDIPANALPYDFTFTIDSVSAGFSINGGALRSMGRFYSFAVVGANGNAVHLMNRNVTISFTYTDAELAALRLNENRLWVFHRAVGSTQWQPLARISRNFAGNVIRVRVRRFSDYAVFADQKAPTLTLARPLANASLKRGAKLAIKPVTADSGGCGIKSVTFYIDGRAKAVDKTVPYSWMLNVERLNLKKGRHVLMLKSADVVGNVKVLRRPFRVR